MNDVIFETVVTTVSPDGAPHVAPMGIRYRSPQGQGEVILMPFKPSTTLDNILATGHATLNIVVDTRVFAGCVTGRRTWPLVPTLRIEGRRLAAALRHLELKLAEQQEDDQRPVLRMAVVHEADHAPFPGFNRAQAAVVEAEMAYLQIAIDKTAGPHEHEAWGWIVEAVARHRAQPGEAA
jgi:hypothetical protein